MEITLALFAAVLVLALACEYMDAAIGMGYGTALSPILLLMDVDPVYAIPAVVFGQICGGLSGSLSHHRLGNVNLNFGRNGWSLDARVAGLLILCGVVGALVAVTTAISVSPFVVKMYVGAMVLVIGIWVILTRNREGSLSWKGLTAIGLVSSFNKGISGGGYGPLVTSGQVINGRRIKNAIGSTTFAEAFVCMVAFVAYVVVGRGISWQLCAATSAGAVIGAPLAAYTVRAVSSSGLKLAVGVATVCLGIMAIVRILV